MCLCGLPFISGFYSKDLVVEAAVGSSAALGVRVVVLGTVMLTAAYSSRVLFLLFRKQEVGLRTSHYSELSPYLVFSICGLGISAFLGGYGIQSLLLGRKDYFNVSLFFKNRILVCLALGVVLGRMFSFINRGRLV